MAGFGRSKFGKGPFGKSDTGRDLIIRSFPVDYFNEDLIQFPGQDPRENESDPLLKILNTFSNLVYRRRNEIDELKTAVDFELGRLDLVRLLGKNLGLNVDKNEPEFLQRSLVGNASEFLQIKASERGYEVRGLAMGFNVEVSDFWRVDESYRAYIPERFLYYRKPVNADDRAVALLHTDVPPGTYPGTPTEEDETYAKSTYVRVIFTIAREIDGVNFNDLLDLAIDKIRDVVGIHHEFVEAQFRIEIPVNVSVVASIDQIDETIVPYDFNEFNRYDIIAADVVECDANAGTVDMSIAVGP